MSININCLDNDEGVWCKNKNVKKSLFGIGARLCTQYPKEKSEGCEFQVKHKKPTTPPPLPPSKTRITSCDKCGR